MRNYIGKALAMLTGCVILALSIANGAAATEMDATLASAVIPTIPAIQEKLDTARFDPCPAKIDSMDNKELETLAIEDQRDRRGGGSTADRKRGDSIRLARAIKLYSVDSLITPQDFARAALLFQHGSGPEYTLLAHELAMVAAIQGCGPFANWLAAASLDRFLLGIDRPQRFGTQSFGPIPMRTDRGETGVTNAVRKILNVPPLAPR